jgi:hypothetical protein
VVMFGKRSAWFSVIDAPLCHREARQVPCLNPIMPEHIACYVYRISMYELIWFEQRRECGCDGGTDKRSAWAETAQNTF